MFCTGTCTVEYWNRPTTDSQYAQPVTVKICLSLVSTCMCETISPLALWRCSNNLNTLRPRVNGRHFADDIFKCVFVNENSWIPIKISLKFVPKGPINNIPALVQIMAWRPPGDKPLSEPMMVRLPTHICVTRPQWVKLEILELISRIDILSTNSSLMIRQQAITWANVEPLLCRHMASLGLNELAIFDTVFSTPPWQ